MARKTKNSDEELLDAATIERVISLLEPADGTKAITKKEACEILRIAYNTTRLNKLIEDYKAKKERTEQRRKALRGKPASSDEIKYAITEYLQGAAIKEIADSLYRGSAFVESLLDAHAVPRRARSQNYDTPELVPDDAMADRFAAGEIVYSMRYDSTARIESFFDSADASKYPKGRIYRIWLLSEKWQQCAYQPVWELASLKHLQELGVKL
jgi:hypothetical protein